jgi:putative heme iron utilization protein
MPPTDHSTTEEAAKLFLSCYDGVLSTLSVTMAGYPFGSVVPFCVDRQGHPIILIADIAQHTKNIRHSPKISLIVFDRSAADLQANGRLTLVGDASLVADGEADTRERYYRYFPSSRDYHLTHGFQFWRLTARRLRYIGGFGAIHWLEPNDLSLMNPFTAEQEVSMVEHMNADHIVAMRRYITDAGFELHDEITPKFAGCDRFGFHLTDGSRVMRIAFPYPVQSPNDVRTALVAMARRE